MSPILFITVLLSCYKNGISQGILFPSNNPQRAGDRCTVEKSGLPGTCGYIRQCPEVLEAMRADLSQQPTICGFTGKDSIVCCPDKSGTVSTNGPSIDEPDVFSSSFCGLSAFDHYYASQSYNWQQSLSLDVAINHPPSTLGKVDPLASQRFRINAPTLLESPDFPLLAPETNTSAGPEYYYSEDGIYFAQGAAGGEDANPSQFPWMAILGRKHLVNSIEWFCDGVLINNRWVLSAAHCMPLKPPDVVRLGEHNYLDANETFHDDYLVERVVLFHEYRPPFAYHDLALIRLTEDVFTNASLIDIHIPEFRTLLLY